VPPSASCCQLASLRSYPYQLYHLLLHSSPHFRLPLLVLHGSEAKAGKRLPPRNYHQHCLPLPPRHRLQRLDAPRRQLHLPHLLHRLPLAGTPQKENQLPLPCRKLALQMGHRLSYWLLLRHRYYRFSRLPIPHPWRRSCLFLYFSVPDRSYHHSRIEVASQLGPLNHHRKESDTEERYRCLYIGHSSVLLVRFSDKNSPGK